MTRLYRLSLHLLPTELRRKHGAAMEALFDREIKTAGACGRLPAVVAVASGIWDVLIRSAYELFRMRDAYMESPHQELLTTRKLLLRHLLSFTTAFVGFTALLLYQFGTRQVPALTARGAGFGTIVETLLLALPFTAAMTIPMAVLLSVLREFTRLGANGTLAAARQDRGGVRRLVAPVLAAAAGMTALAFVVTAEIVPRANEKLAGVMAGHTTAKGGRSMTIGELREAARKVGPGTEPVELSLAASYEVEIQKKLALPAACLALAVAGMALAFRMPRGGVGLVIGGSLLFFGAYYGLITTGENLVERLVVSPFVGMWAANAFVLLISLLAVWRRRGRNRSASERSSSDLRAPVPTSRIPYRQP
ncbi:MAG: LptF/LptG family permease [Gemmatimonadaceae bacterium]